MIRNFTLQTVVSWIGIVAIAGFFLIITLLAGWWLTETTQQDLRMRGRSLAAVMATGVVDPVLLDDPYAAYQVLEHGVQADDEVVYAFIMHADRRIIAHTFADGFPRELLKLCMLHDVPELSYRTRDGYVLDISVPVLSDSLAHLHVGVSQHHVVEQRRRFNLIMTGLLLPLLLVTLYGARLIGQRIGQPLQRLTACARLVAHGGIGPEEIPISGAVEVRQLSIAFRDMLRDLRRLEAEQKAAQVRMVSAERLATTGELAAGLAHEILNPLDGVMECCRQMEPYVAGQERPAKYLRLTRDGLTRIERVMRQLLVFARPQPAPAALTPCPVDALLHDTAELIHPRFVHRGIELEEGPPSGLVCLGSGPLIEQAVLNALLNAGDASSSHAHPRVRLRTTARANWVDIHIEDNGPGVPPEDREQIFQMFFSSKEPGKGTGLGLTTSRTLIEQCGGELVLEPGPADALGGAHFRISLPRHLPPPSTDDDPHTHFPIDPAPEEP